MALRMIGFSESMALSRVCEWAAQGSTNETETSKSKNQRLKRRASLEKYLLRMSLGKKNYDEYVKLQVKYKNKILSNNEIITELMQLGYSRKFAEFTLGKWEKF